MFLKNGTLHIYLICFLLLLNYNCYWLLGNFKNHVFIIQYVIGLVYNLMIGAHGISGTSTIIWPAQKKRIPKN